MLYLTSLNRALHKVFEENNDVVLIGEDLLDPYGGAFKVSKGLSTAYPEQVISTPISEATIVGAATGMAMRGLKPIVEIMFGDFLTLAADQIINHASKYDWIYNSDVVVPLIIRTPVGGRRGYGPTHSQSLESIFMSISGIEIIAPTLCHDPGVMLENLINQVQRPTIFLEYKTDYPKDLCEEAIGQLSILREDTGAYNQNLVLSLFPDEKPDLLIVTYGGNISIAAEAVEAMFFEEEIIANVLVLSSVRPIDEDWLINKVKECGKVLTLEEGNRIGGWGAEVSSIIHEKLFFSLKYPVQRLGSLDLPIPASGQMENQVLPSTQDIFNICRTMSN